MFGAKQFDGVGYPTPLLIPEQTACRSASIPASAEWFGLVMGLMLTLTDENNWQQFEGGITKEAAAAEWSMIVDSMYDSAVGEGACTIPDDMSPYWDDPDAADADGTPEESSYSYTEQIEDWTIAAFVAAAGTPGAAAAYLTIAPRFRLLFRTRDYGGIVKIFIDDVLQAQVDTYSATPGVIAQDIVIAA